MGPAIAIGLTLASAFVQNKAGKEAQKSQEARLRAERKEAATRQRIADIKARRERLNTIRQARIAAATAKATAATTGAAEGSALAGYVGGIKTQTAAALGESQVISAAAREATAYNIRQSGVAQDALSKAGELTEYATIFATGAKAASIFAPQTPRSKPSLTDTEGPF